MSACDRCGDKSMKAQTARLAGTDAKPIPGLIPGRIVYYWRAEGAPSRPALVLEVQDPVAGVVCLRVYRSNPLTPMSRGREPVGEDYEVRAVYAAENPKAGQWSWPPRS